MTTLRIIGAGRAGQSFAAALQPLAYDVELLGRDVHVGAAATGVDAVLIATPDGVIASVASMIEPAEAVIMHCSGATPLAALQPHKRRASIHPLMTLPNAETGGQRLTAGGWFAVAGDPIAAQIVADLNGQSFEVPDDRRALYHATAAVSANHLAALLGQVERLAEAVGVPVAAFFDLAQGSFDDVASKGARAAITGPAARGDRGTIEAHLAALPPSELKLYRVLMQAARDLGADSV